MENWKIKKNRHTDFQPLARITGFVPHLRVIRFAFRLSKEAWYPTQSGVNDHEQKISGVSINTLWHHENSVRITYRPAEKPGKFILSLYVYRDGQPPWSYPEGWVALCPIHAEKDYECEISLYWPFRYVKIKKPGVSKPLGISNLPVMQTPEWGMLLFPYYEGPDECGAPHHFTIHLQHLHPMNFLTLLRTSPKFLFAASICLLGIICGVLLLLDTDNIAQQGYSRWWGLLPILVFGAILLLVYRQLKPKNKA